MMMMNSFFAQYEINKFRVNLIQVRGKDYIRWRSNGTGVHRLHFLLTNEIISLLLF